MPRAAAQARKPRATRPTAPPPPPHDPAVVDGMPITIGETIKVRRLNLGLSQRALAKQLGTTNGRIILWEQDKHAPSPTHADNLARVLGGDATDYQPGAYQPQLLTAMVASLTLQIEALTARLATLERRLDSK